MLAERKIRRAHTGIGNLEDIVPIRTRRQPHGDDVLVRIARLYLRQCIRGRDHLRALLLRCEMLRAMLCAVR